MSIWKITPNTDSVDIDQKCIGLSPRRSSIPSDVAEHIHRDRGLHIQIRHNGDRQAFTQANDLSRLIAAAPEMLAALKEALANLRGLDVPGEGYEAPVNALLRDVINKAEGKTP